jgi:signal transduction histidine kinase
MKRPLSWSMRFALALSTVFVIAALSAGGVSYVLQSRVLSQRLAADVQAMAEGLAHPAQEGDRPDVVEQISAQLLAARDASTLVAFIDPQTGDTIGNLRVATPFVGGRRLETGHGLTVVGAPRGNAAEAYYAYGIRTDLGWIIAARDVAWIVDSGKVLLQTTAWWLGVALVLSTAIALVIARRNERRVLEMERVLDAVGAGRFDQRIHDRAADDLAELAERVDRMLDRLEAGIAAIRQVSTDVAHDLRAPLARLRMRLEPSALDHGLPAETRHEIGAALADIDAISQTFDSILRLARLQSGSVERHVAPVDLCALARDTQEILGPSAEDSGHTLQLDLPAGAVIVSGDGELLSQALINLVDNALRHCPAPARVVLAVKGGAGTPEVSVCDNGPGIAPEDRPRVVERFVRLDRSRTTPGTGLGLSLVAAIADLHGAALLLEDNHPGLCARLSFPAQGPSTEVLTEK